MAEPRERSSGRRTWVHPHPTHAMKLLLTLFILAAAASVNIAQSDDHPATAEELKLRDRLESMSSIVQLRCGLMMPILPGEMYAAEAKQQQADNNKYRLEFYRAVKAGRSAKLSYHCGTDEGDTVAYYLLAMGGNLTHIADFSRDRFGGNRFIKTECTDLRLAHHVKNAQNEITVEPLDEKNLKGKVLWLTCKSPARFVTF